MIQSGMITPTKVKAPQATTTTGASMEPGSTPLRNQMSFTER